MHGKRKRGHKTGERLRSNGYQGVCKNREEMVTYLEYLLVRQTKIPAGTLLRLPAFLLSAELLIIVPSDRTETLNQRSPLIGSITLFRTLKCREYLYLSLWAWSYLWPPDTILPSGPDSQSFAFIPIADCHTEVISTSCTADHHAPTLITQTEATDSSLAEHRR